MSTRFFVTDAREMTPAALEERSAVNAPARATALDQMDPHLVSLVSPRSFEADQYRVLRHFVDQTAGEPLRLIAVTSPSAGDGKTTTAVNLAGTLAQLPGARVLLIDADLRRPLVASSLGLDGGDGPGLAATATDPHLSLDDIVRRTPFDFDIVPAGAPAPNAAVLFDSPRLGQLLDQARQRYDRIVLDTPPLLLVPDSRLMAQWVDGFVFVVAANRTPRKLLAESLNALEPQKILGIVFNGDERPLGGYYGRYKGYYGYHQESATGRRRWRFPWRRAAEERSHRWS